MRQVVDPMPLSRFNNAMRDSEYQLCMNRVELLRQHLCKVEARIEAQDAENRRLQDVLRLAEHELEKRRQEIREMEEEITRLRRERNEARARVEHAIERIDQLMRTQAEEPKHD